MVGTKDSAHEEYYNEEFDQDPYEEEEALSLCDLPIYGDSFKWDDEFSGSSSNKRDQSLSFEENDNNDYFEFFSSDFSSADFSSGHNSINNNKDIIFCGKLIRYKEFPQVENLQNKKISEKKQKPPTKKKSIFQYWKSSNDNEKSSNRSSSKRSENDTSLWSYDKMGKSRWYLYMFGMTRLPTTEMELRDIKSRQSRRLRRSPTTMFPQNDNKGAETTKDKVSSPYSSPTKPKRRRSGKGWWGLLRVLSCRSRHAEAVAKASFGCNAIARA